MKSYREVCTSIVNSIFLKHRSHSVSAFQYFISSHISARLNSIQIEISVPFISIYTTIHVNVIWKCNFLCWSRNFLFFNKHFLILNYIQWCIMYSHCYGYQSTEYQLLKSDATFFKHLTKLLQILVKIHPLNVLNIF